MERAVERGGTEGERGREAAVRLEGVSVRAGKRTLLEDVNLSVAAGERLALIGPSGAGKTTLLRLIGASLWADEGSVRVLGEEPRLLRGRAMRNHRRNVGFLRQEGNLVEPLRVAHNVTMGQLGRWSTIRAFRQLLWPTDLGPARAALREVELEDRLWALPEELSGGERQRVALARMIVQEPELFLADEPVSALDVRLGAQVIDMLMAIARRRAASLVVSLHSLELLDRGFDRVVALRSGKVRWTGVPGELDRVILGDVYGSESQNLGVDALTER